METGNARLTALRLERARRRGFVPASSSQLRLWLVDQLDPGNPVYNITRAFAVHGKLDAMALEQAISVIVAKHAVLRTTFSIVDGEVIAHAREATPFRLGVSRIRIGDERSRPDIVEREVARAAGHRFDLAHDVMLRATLVRFAPEDHLLTVTLHHIAVDEQSIDVLLNDLSRTYHAVVAGEVPDRTPPAIEFAAYALRERGLAESDEFAAQLDYWQKRLSGAPASVELPFDRARPSRPHFSGATEAVVLDREASANLLALAPLSGASPFMLLFAAFALTVHGIAGHRDLVIGTPVSARHSGELDATVGFFSNATALRVTLEGDPTFLDVVRLAKTATLDAFANSAVPFEAVVARVAGERTRHVHPVFNVMFAAQSESMAKLALEGVRCDALEVANTAAKFDLSVMVRPGLGEIAIGFTYDTDLFERETIAALLDDYHTILRAVAASPNTRISQLPPRSDARAHVGVDVDATANGRKRFESRADERAGEDGTREPGGREATAELRAIEADLRPLWEAALGRPGVPANEDFFEGGGHSLLAVRLVDEIEKKLGVRLPLAAFFETPTLERLALTIASLALTEQLEMQPLRRGSHPVPVVFFHGDMSGGGLYLRSMLDALGDRTVYGLPPHGADGGPIPATFEAMASDRLAMLARAGVRGEMAFVGYCSGAVVALEAARQLKRRGAMVPKVIVLEADVVSRGVRRLRGAVQVAGRVLRLDGDLRERIVLGLLRFRKDWRASHGAGERLQMTLGRLQSLARIGAGGAAARAAAVTLGAAPVRVSEAERTDRMIFAYQRRAVRFRPQRYLQPLTVLLAAGERNTASRMKTWKMMAPGASLHFIAGDHTTCVTTYGRDAAMRLREFLDDA